MHEIYIYILNYKLYLESSGAQRQFISDTEIYASVTPLALSALIEIKDCEFCWSQSTILLTKKKVKLCGKLCVEIYFKEIRIDDQ